MSAPHPAVALLQDLIRCPSVTPQEGGALQLLRKVLVAAGFDVEIARFSAPGTPDVDNLFAKIGSGAPHFTFAGHTDVVPPGDTAKWHFDPFSGTIADGKVWGRGTADMKGGVAAFAAAALGFLKKHAAPKGTISLLITGDEEGPAVNGTVKLLEWAKARGEIFDHCIVGEPTNPNALGDMIKIGRRGSLTGRLVVHGKQGHVGYPHLADNPIPAMLRLLTALKAKPLDEGTPHFDASNLEVTTVDTGNAATNVIPAEVRAVFNIRFNDVWTPESLEAELRARCAAVAAGAAYTLTFDPTNAVAFLTEPGDFTTLVATAVHTVTGRTPQLSTTGGTSDARFIQHYCPVVEFGLVGQTMHQVDEHVAVADVEQLAVIYEKVLEAYFLQQ
ncbi:succinyl-diaminopimelate desuccinylase [Methylovirgula sp. 4M-Z18]|uniref:succinyl-diaminopimelate desuccinylase n=1 Tax=Methylovirgula sp. 4M-Z18 TaxID=2293567 RepID=UPI000E2F6C82|nr:succinyl-diaminopimelate desuccinylase [Methylovirgula sp. 4M-Z18]RFB79536.1 succinyl-diaminopimelate desuccinylase [Methylovirgula sp. 4M-Z18]